MSFSEDCVRFGVRLAKLVDAGVPVREAAGSLGVSRQRAYAILRATGRPMGSSRPDVSAVDRGQVAAVFTATASVNAAAKAGGVAHATARRMLVEAGLIDAARQQRGKPAQRARFFELLDDGWPTAAAAREVGVSERTARDWRDGIRQVGNTRVYPDGTVHDYATGTRYTQPVKTVAAHQSTAPDDESVSRYLRLVDRLVIADGLAAGLSYTAIADKIGRNKSTVSREVAAHRVEGLYLPYQADAAAAAARARPKASKLVTNQRLRKEVEEGLAKRWSPEEISHRLVRDFPDDESMRVSHETIYQSLYFQARGGLKKEVAQALRSGRTCRKPNRKPGERYQRFVDPMIMIADRPDIEDRAVPGHWEGDLIMGELNKTAIATLVERATRYTMLVHLPGGHDAETVRDGLIATMKTLPAHLRGSLTWDQGAEMAGHKGFTTATDMQVYFCDPASPWQRGTNENTNGLLRQYFPKGTDLSVYGPEDLEHVAQQLNGRPRKTLDWDTPAERLRDLLLTD
ncbi:integrase [Mycobacterium vulneris]|nr:integrase [Mycolicibacterium vulneris]OCB67208.1 integrase [Mycolicibacterium vulneris]